MTRKNGRLSERAKVNILKQFAKVNQIAVSKGIDIYLHGHHYEQGKRENYLWAIIRSQERAMALAANQGSSRVSATTDLNLQTLASFGITMN